MKTPPLRTEYILSILLFLFFCSITSFGQGYTSYFTGNAEDVISQPLGGVCLMGGATENDQAMIWFLERAAGGDVLVLRASGSDGYNAYLYSDLGVNVNSVETIVFTQASASENPYVLERIEKAEAIWFAGGNQWNYVSYWRNTSVAQKINQGISERNMVIGGTSAGMAIQGSHYFTAQNGTLTSMQALQNPYGNLVTVESSTFIQNEFLQNTITDTHFDNPSRKGRLTTFLARMRSDDNIIPRGIACDEYTAVCIDAEGVARVYGSAAENDYAYFVTSNCAHNHGVPELCQASAPLTWDLGGEALVVLRIKGNEQGSGGLDLNTWDNPIGADWFYWSVSDGQFSEIIASPFECTVMTEESQDDNILAFPNPVKDVLYLNAREAITVKNVLGSCLFKGSSDQIDFSSFASGIYFVQIGNETIRILKP